ncbi:MAG: hypothetical protein C0503_07125 [Gemmatimonas sp.]|nr:hypothetical protein [Gemmatimonas sp.]
MIPSKATPKRQSLFRELSAERRVALLTKLIAANRDTRAVFIQRMVARGGGFRAATLQAWAPAKLASEVVRLNAQTPDDELDLLHALYVSVEPQIQETFLKAAGVKAEGAVIDESLEAPFADATGVQRGAAAVLEQFGEEGKHYLRTIAHYNAAAWPGVETVVAAFV